MNGSLRWGEKRNHLSSVVDCSRNTICVWQMRTRLSQYTCIACEWQKSLQRGSSGSCAIAQSNHEDTRKKCILAFLGNAEWSLRRQRQWQLVGQVSRSSFNEDPRRRSVMHKRRILLLQWIKLARVSPRNKNEYVRTQCLRVSQISKSKRQGARTIRNMCSLQQHSEKYRLLAADYARL